jgi:hypothetical protein
MAGPRRNRPTPKKWSPNHPSSPTTDQSQPEPAGLGFAGVGVVVAGVVAFCATCAGWSVQQLGVDESTALFGEAPPAVQQRLGQFTVGHRGRKLRQLGKIDPDRLTLEVRQVDRRFIVITILEPSASA